MQYTTWMEHALWTYVLPMCPPSRTQCSHGMWSHPWENLVTELCWGQSAVPAIFHQWLKIVQQNKHHNPNPNFLNSLGNFMFRLQCQDAPIKFKQLLLISSSVLGLALRSQQTKMFAQYCLSFLENVRVTFWGKGQLLWSWTCESSQSQGSASYTWKHHLDHCTRRVVVLSQKRAERQHQRHQHLSEMSRKCPLIVACPTTATKGMDKKRVLSS